MNIAELNEKEINTILQKIKNATPFESKETIHSRIIAYFLLNQPEFLKQILGKLGYKAKNLQQISVKTEENHIDIMVENKDFVLVIENKYKDRNRENQNTNTTKKEDDRKLGEQLERYENLIMKKEFNTGKQCLFVYLRPFLHRLKNKNWKAFTYKDFLEILKTLNPDGLVNEYKDILEEIYKPQKICITALKEVLNFKEENICVDDQREDINGYSIEIPLNNFNNKYNSFIQFEHFEPVEKRGKVTINLVVNEEYKTVDDKNLLETVSNKLKRKIKSSKQNEYKWVRESVCKNCDFSEEFVRKQIKNSRMIDIIKKELHLSDDRK